MKKSIAAARVDRSANLARDNLNCQKGKNYIGADLLKRKLHITREIRLTQISVLITLIVSVMLLKEIFVIFIRHFGEADYWRGIEQILFAMAVFFLIYGNLVYQVTRLGYLMRLKAHRPATRDELNRIYDSPAPALTVLIPSYKEEHRLIRQALLSAALQEYPNRRIVLLIDDPPEASNPEDLTSLSAARRLPHEIQNLLEGQAAEFDAALDSFLRRKEKGLTISEEYFRLAGLYRKIAAWFAEQASSYSVNDHTDRWFVKKTFEEPVRLYVRHALDMELYAEKESDDSDESTIAREYNRLACLFKVELASFERKRYVNLSHEPNKAMNLNSYIGLLGKSHCEIGKDGLTYLEHAESGSEGFIILDAEYVITLDADSMLLPEYALRLIHIMEQPGNEKLAVVQTPYNAFPNPPGLLERIAGATTDIQHIIHQGFTRHNATYWVGANALLRKSALEDICTVMEERGFTVKRYIQDRTVIEDTESSIDLIDRGWKLCNYPERLSYSATPPDFGSLLIQRRRWANGGLIILPKLLRYWCRASNIPKKMGEGLLRFHYLTSITGVNAGLLLMLVFPFEENLRSIWLPLTALPYYFLYGRDLVQSGYRISDFFRVYALNLLLVPINLVGVLKSIHQAWTGQKIPFGRTPKVLGRTSAPSFYVMAELLLLFYCVTGSLVDAINGRWLHAVFALMTGSFLTYAVIKYIGLRESREDILRGWASSRLYQKLLVDSRNSLMNSKQRKRVKPCPAFVGGVAALLTILINNIQLTYVRLVRLLRDFLL